MNRKKIVGFMLALGCLSALLPKQTGIISTAEEISAADAYFMEFVLSDTEYKGKLEYTSTPLYNEELEKHGNQYNFKIGGAFGYALLIEIRGENKTLYEIEELFYNTSSPFDDCNGLPVFLTHNLYLDYVNGSFYDLETRQIIAPSFVKEIAYKGFGYCGAAEFVTQIQTVSYADKTTTTYSIPSDLPNYFGEIGETTCANTAGAVLIGYYDRFCENLIPNFQSYVRIGTLIRYKTGATEIADLMDQLHIDMNTDVSHQGTTYAEFQDGMETYVERQGYTYTTTNVFTSGSFNFLKYKTSIEVGKPVAIFLSGFAMLNSITEETTTDTINSGYCQYTHVAVGCGYRQDTYYDSNNTVLSTRTYLKVASGLSDYNIGYLNINGFGKLDHAISVTIE